MALSVIIPLGPRDDDITPIIAELADLPKETEIIIALGNGREIQNDFPHRVRIVEGAPGRASQMNAAAHEAKGDLLWFLHVDSKLAPGLVPNLLRTAESYPDALLYNDLAFLNDGPALMSLNALAVRFRSDVLKMPFGDQGFCLTKSVFFNLGGYDEQAQYGEDHLLVWKAHQTGVPLRRTGSRIFTSARKYASGGWGKITGMHVWLTVKQAAPELIKLLRSKIS